MQSTTEVAIRIRPPFTFEHFVETPCIFPSRQPYSKDLVLPNQEIFPCDYTFGSEVDQNTFYEKCVKTAVWLGITSRMDVNIIAFGPLCSGKSYTLFGPDRHNQHSIIHSETTYGIAPRLLRQVFTCLMGHSPAFSYKVGISVLEVSNGHTRSLLGQNRRYVQGSPTHIKNYEVHSVGEALEYLHFAMMFRRHHVSFLKTLSDSSSCIVTVHIHESYRIGKGDPLVCEYKINIVDLANVEEQHGYVTNAGLVTMSHLIGYTVPHIGTADPVLLHLLKQMWNNSCHNLVICCLSPSIYKYEDILNHLLLVNQMTHLNGQFGKKVEVERKLLAMLRAIHCNEPIENTHAHAIMNDNTSTQPPDHQSDNVNLNTNMQQDDNRCNQEVDENSNFGLQFAATEMNKLVSNAEDLFQLMMLRSDLPEECKQQIDHWIDLKQEYESCISSENNSTCEEAKKGLEKIDEVTESTVSIDCSCLQCSVEIDCDIDSGSSVSSCDTYCRRKSILPGENPMALMERNNSVVCLSNLVNTLNSDDSCDDNVETKVESLKEGGEDIRSHCNDLKTQAVGSDVKQNQLELVTLEAEGLNKRMGALQVTIDLKEKFINDMMKNCDIRTDAKARIIRKHNQIETDYYKARTNLALAEKALHEENCSSNEENVDQCKTLSLQYERQLHDIQMITQIAGESGNKVLELENSLQDSRKKMQKMLKQAKKDEDYKLCLEQKIKHQNTAKVEEEQSKLRKLKDSKDQKQDYAESTELLNAESIGEVSQHVKGVDAHAIHMNRCKADVDVKCRETLHHEIRNLRRTRESLDSQRHNLVSKFNKDKVLSKLEERKFLECDEAIEGIDVIIEYKNNIISGGNDDIKSDRKNESMLLARLSKLSVQELRYLLCKYYRKVVDLRESGRKMESQIAELDRRTEGHLLRIQTLSNALQQAHLEAERKMVIAQREHQEKIHLLYRHFAEDTAGPSTSDSDVREHNRFLAQRVVELESKLIQYTGGAMQPQNPQDNLLHIEGKSSNTPRTTKVTRHKNKLIIQKQKSKKPPK